MAYLAMLQRLLLEQVTSKRIFTSLTIKGYNKNGPLAFGRWLEMLQSEIMLRAE